MTRLCAVLMLWCSIASAQWIEGSIVGTFKRDGLPPMAVSWSGPAAQWNVPADADWRLWQEQSVAFPNGARSGWITVDVSAFVPAGVIAVDLDGQLVITPRADQAPVTCYLNVELREFGSKKAINGIYIADVVSPYGGPRQNAYTRINVVGGKFQVRWFQSTYAQWPDGCAYGWNFRVVGYVR